MIDLFYHEDFHRQIELIPKQNYFATSRTIRNHPKSEGTPEGFLTCHIREEHLMKTEAIKASFMLVKELLSPLALSFHDTVTSGYSTTTYKVEHTVAWGFETYGIFVEHQNDLVKHIWLCSNSNFPSIDPGYKLYSALSNLTIELDLILVDWNEKVIVNTTNRNQLRTYLNQVLGFDIARKPNIL